MVRTWSCPKMGIHNVSGGLQGGPVHKLGARGGAGWRLLMWVVLPRVSSWVPERNGETLLVSRMRYAEPLSSRNLWGAVHQGGLAGCRVGDTHMFLRKSGCQSQAAGFSPPPTLSKPWHYLCQAFPSRSDPRTALFSELRPPRVSCSRAPHLREWRLRRLQEVLTWP